MCEKQPNNSRNHDRVFFPHTITISISRKKKGKQYTSSSPSPRPPSSRTSPEAAKEFRPFVQHSFLLAYSAAFNRAVHARPSPRNPVKHTLNTERSSIHSMITCQTLDAALHSGGISDKVLVHLQTGLTERRRQSRFDWGSVVGRLVETEKRTLRARFIETVWAHAWCLGKDEFAVCFWIERVCTTVVWGVDSVKDLSQDDLQNLFAGLMWILCVDLVVVFYFLWARL
ncbi:hypothetical protein BDU57DRAFT_48764 [Ampelomyces quisqualis]|uniref:Uncharacterized protein n=1 Tax=Ampelomyces quisqualis TaxID=50730 RepID=A0A6A5R1Y0_AMPQU|nr:hypothetical protein BDU57DRAFT_48764 [Ampelomyces quisqualis]